MSEITNDYLLDKKVKMFQKDGFYRTSSDAVLLASMVTNTKDNAKILDVGAGTGGVSLCLAYRLKNVQITGFEIQPDLTELANKSASANGFDNLQCLVLKKKKKKALCAFCSFDVVVTNPPYGNNGSQSPNASKATAHNGQDITLEQWLKFCIKMLKPFGKFYMIDRAEALDEILSILRPQAGNIKVVPVYSKAGQKAKRVMISAQKDSKTPLEILPPLYIHEANAHTKEAEAILRNAKSYFEIFA